MTTFKRWYGMITLGILTLLMGATFVAQGQTVQGAVVALETPTRPGPPTLTATPIPPTDTVEPTLSSPRKAASQSEGAFIVLQVTCTEPPPRTSYWTAVQWQDNLGTWHTVEGWQGTFDEFAYGQGIKRWWLPPSLFNQGPFRWVVYTGRGGEVLVFSTPFYLPGATLQTTRIEVLLIDNRQMPIRPDPSPLTIYARKSVAISKE